MLLVGQLGGTIKGIKDSLTHYFQVQTIMGDLNAISGKIEQMKPDLIIVCMSGLPDTGRGVLAMLSTQYDELPIITICTSGEYMLNQMYCEGEQFENLFSPVNNEQVLRRCGELLGVVVEREVNIRNEDSNKRYVLVVDDDPLLLRSIKRILDAQYDVAVATSGVQAMTAMEKPKPDLILLDYEMPICDGKQTLQMIRGEEDLKDIPVIFLTGVSEKENIVSVLKMKPAGYLLKPVEQDRLLGEIAKVLCNRA